MTLHNSQLHARHPRLSFTSSALARVVALLFAGVLSLATACSGGGGDDAPPPADPEARLSDPVVNGMDELPDPEVPFSQVMLPNGILAEDFLALFPSLGDTGGGPTGPQDTKNYLIARLAQKASQLTTRSNWVYPDEGAESPAQNGLAYVFGSKQVETRSRGATSCSPLLHGLDCSGFLALCFASAGVPIPVGTASTQRTVSVLTNAMRSVPQFDALYAENLGAIAPNEMESGDIVYWNDASGSTKHIGLVLNGAVFQSNGSSSCDSVQLLRNRGSTRGPRQFGVGQVNTFFAESGLQLGGVVRILAEISGTWRFNLRCQTATFDILDSQIEFPPSQSGQFQVVQNFLDYNGQPLTGSFDFTYVRESNTLSCIFGLSTPNCSTNPFRTESFSVQLDRDDTGYVPTVGVNRTPCSGCEIEVRFRNLETNGGPQPLQLMLHLLDQQPARITIGPASGR